MNKSEFSNAVAVRLPDLHPMQVRAVIDAVFDQAKETLSNGDNIKIASFGVLEPKFLAARVARNPRKGTPVPVDEKITIRFRISESWKTELNS